CQTTEALCPEWLGLRRPHRHAEHLAASVRVRADRYYYGNGYDPPALTDLDVGGINPQNSIKRRGNVFSRSSISSHRRETWLFEMPASPIALARSPTARVDRPFTYAF